MTRSGKAHFRPAFPDTAQAESKEIFLRIMRPFARKESYPYILRRNRESVVCSHGKIPHKGLSHLPDPAVRRACSCRHVGTAAELLGRCARPVAGGAKPCRSFSKNAGTQTYRSMFQTLVIRIAMGIVNPEGEGRGSAQGRRGRPSVRAGKSRRPAPGKDVRKNDKIVY